MFHETVTAKGHLIDNQTLDRVFDLIADRGAAHEILQFDIGKRSEDESFVRMKVTAPDRGTLDRVIEGIIPYGCEVESARDARWEDATKDCCVPEDFYSTTNHKTQVRIDGRWANVGKQRMDAVIVLEDDGPMCRKLRDVKKGDRALCGAGGVRVTVDQPGRKKQTFAFMNNDISSERRVETSLQRVISLMKEVREKGERIVVVAGPVVIHTGGIEPFSRLVDAGWIDVLLSGNAIAVHDIENCFFGTSLGVSLEKGVPVEEGHKNHMRAINRICHAGSITEAVEQGVLTSGIMHSLVKNHVKFVLAGSIRDDGPLPDTIMDLIEAQEQYGAELKGAGLVLMLSTMLHSIGVGNMLPSWVNVVCVDINPAVVTKLSDRGSSQTVGIVTDVGLFLQRLSDELC